MGGSREEGQWLPLGSTISDPKYGFHSLLPAAPRSHWKAGCTSISPSVPLGFESL